MKLAPLISNGQYAWVSTNHELVAESQGTGSDYSGNMTTIHSFKLNTVPDKSVSFSFFDCALEKLNSREPHTPIPIPTLMASILAPVFLCSYQTQKKKKEVKIINPREGDIIN